MSTPTPTHTAVQLLHCPFCGHGSPEVCDGYVVCPNCGASTHEFDTPEEATAAWNSRPQGERPPHELWQIALDYAVACGELSMGLQEDDPMWADLLALGKRLDAMTGATTSSVAPGGQPLPQADSQEGFGDSVFAPVEPSGATLSPGAGAERGSPPDGFTITTSRVTPDQARRFADELEAAIGEVGRMRRRPGNLPLEPMARLIQFARQPQVDRGESSSEGGES